MKRMLLFLIVLTVASPAAAQIDIAELQIENSPDVRDWAPTAAISKIEFWRGAGMHIEFDKRASWPDVVPPGWDGPVQHTVWLLLKIDGHYRRCCLPTSDWGQLDVLWLLNQPLHGRSRRKGHRHSGLAVDEANCPCRR